MALTDDERNLVLCGALVRLVETFDDATFDATEARQAAAIERALGVVADSTSDPAAYRAALPAAEAALRRQLAADLIAGERAAVEALYRQRAGVCLGRINAIIAAAGPQQG